MFDINRLMATNAFFWPLVLLAGVILLIVIQVLMGLISGSILMPGKTPNGFFRVDRVTQPIGYWIAIVIQTFVLFLVVRTFATTWEQNAQPGPPEPTGVSVVATAENQVEISWLAPDRVSSRMYPRHYAIFRSSEPGVEAGDYQCIVRAIKAFQYTDRSVEPNTRYYYRIGANYEHEPMALSDEDTAVTVSPISSPAGPR